MATLNRQGQHWVLEAQDDKGKGHQVTIAYTLTELPSTKGEQITISVDWWPVLDQEAGDGAA